MRDSDDADGADDKRPTSTDRDDNGVCEPHAGREHGQCDSLIDGIAGFDRDGHSNSDDDRDANGYVHLYADCDANGYGDGDTYGNAHRDSDRHPNLYADGDSDGHPDGNTDRDRHGHIDLHSHPDSNGHGDRPKPGRALGELAGRTNAHAHFALCRVISSVGNWWGRALSEVRERRVLAEAAAVALVVLLALILRIYRLDSLPGGLHGDEAIAGLEAEHILRDGWIGPYSPLALGQPAGPLYLVAPAEKLFGNTAFAVRLAPALIGALTVLVLFLAVRARFGRAEGFVSAALLAPMGWHLLLTRTGFPVGSWPLVTLLAAWALSRAIRTESIRWYAVAGAVTAAGIYVYNAHYIVIGAVLLLLLGVLVARRYHPLARDLLCMAAFACGLIVASLPMVRYAADGSNGYFQHFRAESITGTTAWDARDTPLAKARLLAERYGDSWKQLLQSPRIDGVDGSGLTRILPWTLVALAAAGMALGWWRRRDEPLTWIGSVIILAAPVGAALSNQQGVARRSFEMTPFVAMFAAIAVVELGRFVARRGGRPAWRLAGGTAVSAAVLVCGSQGVIPYFTTFADSSAQRWTYAADFTEASRFMATLNPGDYVYLASDRQSINYEARQFLAPKVQGEDIGPRNAVERWVYFPARGRPMFILLGRFRDELPELERQNPGGAVVLGPATDTGPAFIAYELPRRAAFP